MALDIWAVGNGSMIAMGLNAVATMFNSNSWQTLLWIGETLGVLTCVGAYIKTHDLRGVFAWAMTFCICTAILLTPKVTVVVNDLTRPDRIDRVDNVPVGLAVPLYLLTGIGYSLATTYEDFFHFPDERSYSKTGMMFGSRLLQDSFVMAATDPELQSNFNEYVKNCIIPDAQLNHKFSLEAVMHSAEMANIIFSQPSPLRGIYFRSGANSTFMTCRDATPRLKSALSKEASGGGGTFMYHASRMFPGNKQAQVLYPGMLESSYSYFFAAGKTARDIIQQNVLIAGMRRGTSSYVKSMNDTASLVDIASEQSLMKLRLSHATSYKIAQEILPQLHTVMLMLCVSIFPVMVLALFVREMTWNVVKNYLNILGSLMLWPVMFAIFNFIVNWGTQISFSGEGPTLSNMNRLMETSSTTGGLAGWLMMSIPFLSFKLFTSLGERFASAGSYLGNALAGAATADSGNVASGNYNINNQSVDNINGFKRDLNVVNREGMVTNQLPNGALETRTGGGQTVYDGSGAMSRLPVDLNFDHHMASAAQKMTRDSLSQTQTAMEGYNHSVAQTAGQMRQFHNQFGNSDSATVAAQTGMSVNDADKFQKATNVVDAYAQKNHLTYDQAYSELQNKSKSLDANIGTRGSAGIDSSKSLGGKVGQWITGASFKGDVHAGLEGRGSTGSTSQTTEGGRSGTDTSHDISAQDMKTFSEGVTVARNYNTNFNGAHVDNAAAGLMTQISTGITTSDARYQQFTNSQARTHEYQQMASQTDTLSAQARSNYTQEFVEYVRREAPDEAAELLTNADNPVIRERREAMVETFMQDKLKGRLDDYYETRASQTGDNIAGVGNNAIGQMGGAYQHYNQDIDGKVHDAGIKTDMKATVMNNIDQTQNRMDQHEDYVHNEKTDVDAQHADRKNDFSGANKDFREKHHAAELHQGNWNPVNVLKSDYKDYIEEAKDDLSHDKK
ncbi:conjugal transfer mating-pair stabilization protein TraG [Serratia marcescens]|uniref:conjugal transfer mating-pair stabilization protein TraG n=1 Tax=Serratia marcescens TaxID=615 RepID=UPI003204B38E